MDNDIELIFDSISKAKLLDEAKKLVSKYNINWDSLNKIGEEYFLKLSSDIIKLELTAFKNFCPIAFNEMLQARRVFMADKLLKQTVGVEPI